MLFNNIKNNILCGTQKIYNLLIKPLTKTEDNRRRELILNIILISIICLSFLLDISVLLSEMTERFDYKGIDFFNFSLIVLFLILLLIISRLGYYKFSSYGLLSICLGFIMYAAYHWGIDLPAAMLGYGFIVILSGVLFDAKFASIIAGIITIFISIIGYLQINQHINIEVLWRQQSFRLHDLIIFVALLLAILVLSWISNNQIEKSLKRARKSEHLLLLERDALEVKVEERTKEIRNIQAERLEQLSKFAEFGKVASGLFHDLSSPVTSVSLHSYMLKDAPAFNPEVKKQLEQLHQTSKRMENFVIKVKKQLQQKSTSELFSINQEVKDTIAILRHKALIGNINIEFKAEKDMFIFGDNFKFQQTLLNLISNAIDSYSSYNIPTKSPIYKDICITLRESDENIFIEVKDYGSGIPIEIQEKIFEPFFSTKTESNGTGIGLSITKDIIEKEFRGTIKLQSEVGKGSTFLIQLPKS